MSLPAARRDFCEKVVRGMESLRTQTLCRVGESMFVNCTVAERHYLETLCGIPTEKIDTWSGTSCKDSAASAPD